jgi:hypothetical protein
LAPLATGKLSRSRTVTKMPIVLTSNEINASSRYDWDDVTGVRYHYPNGYRNLIRQGDRFVYYRGVRRKDRTRAAAEYFGCGLVGDVWRDPSVSEDALKAHWSWYCSIQDYAPFDPPVPAKIDGVFFEKIPPNMWRNGVRKIGEDQFRAILGRAGIVFDIEPSSILALPELPPLDDVVIHLADDLLLPTTTTNIDSTAGPSGQARYSRRSVAIGRRAEEIALRWVRQAYPHARDLIWLANEGETPGWDLQFLDGGELTGVEVKGTSGVGFLNFELTANELRASRKLGARYILLLVADCLGTAPRVQAIQNPAALLQQGQWALQATRFRVTRLQDAIRSVLIGRDAFG